MCFEGRDKVKHELGEWVMDGSVRCSTLWELGVILSFICHQSIHKDVEGQITKAEIQTEIET